MEFLVWQRGRDHYYNQYQQYIRNFNVPTTIENRAVPGDLWSVPNAAVRSFCYLPGGSIFPLHAFHASLAAGCASARKICSALLHGITVCFGIFWLPPRLRLLLPASI